MLYSNFLVVIRRLALLILIKPTGLHMLSVRKLVLSLVPN